MKGGDMNVIAGNADTFHTYFEKNETIRNTTTFEFDKKFTENNSFKLKQSLSFFDRKINIPNYEFAGFNTNIFTDASYLWTTKKQTVITGLNFQYDNFKQSNVSTLDAKSNTIGAYIQQTWDISEDIKLENGLRIDNVNYSNPNFSKNQMFVLPKISALFKFNNKWSSRIGGG
jgi:iron complex outermembrane receptor protein/outer membrane receptor for ferrienterochelin and colicins